MMKKRRKTVRIISFLTALVTVLGIWGVVSSFNLAVAKRQIKASDERALTQLGTYLDDINLNLQKSMYCKSSSMLSDVSTELWRSSTSAKESLSEITDSNTQVSDMYKFLSQVGEYTLSINKKIGNKEKLSKAETENLKKLLKYSEQLSESVNYLISQQENGLLDFEEVKTTLQSSDNEKMYLGNELNDANQSLNDYPTLIYDGPFSDHINNKESVFTKNLKSVSEEKSKKIAAEFMGVKENSIKLLSKTNNNLSTFNFYNADYSVSVTQKGGIVSSFMTSQYASEIKLTTKQAIKKATEFLKSKGYDKIKESYYSTTDGICTINFSYYDKGVTYYTDLIKVSVALDDGEITAFDATGYLMNHKVRSLPSGVKYNIEEAKKYVKNDLKIKSYKKAFIPTEWETEEYVYEYHCIAPDKKEVLVYIDPVTGDERDILILLYSDGGVLTK